VRSPEVTTGERRPVTSDRPPIVESQPATGNGHHAPDAPQGDTPSPAHPSRRRLVLAILIPVVVIVAVLLARWIAYHRTHVSTDDATVDGDLYAVNARVGGRVTRVLVNANQAVRRGQLLVELDPRDLQAQLDQAEATLAVEQANARAAGAGVGITRATTSSATGQKASSARSKRAASTRSSTGSTGSW